MNRIKRAKISLYRQPVKSVILLLVIFMLSVLSIGAVSVRYAIVNTDVNLRRSMPAVAYVRYHQYGDMVQHPSRELVRKIGTFPEVYLYDYFITILNSGDVHAYGLVPWEHPDTWNQLETNPDYEPGFGTRVTINGVGSSHFLEVRNGFMTLVEGRGFTERELTETSEWTPILITTGFAQFNGLTVGSTFELLANDFEWRWFDATEHEQAQVKFPVHVIGIFEPTIPQFYDERDGFVNPIRASATQHRMYVPSLTAEMMMDVIAGEGTISTADEYLFHHMFLLTDPLAFDAFAQAVSALDGNWRAVDYSRGLGNIVTAMAGLQEVVDMMLTLTVVAMLLMVCLTLLLCLNDRKREIGIYLALGESRKGIMTQMVMEIIPLVLLAMTFALFVGSTLAGRLSQEMLRQALANTTRVNTLTSLEGLGYRFEFTNEETLDMYDVTLSADAIIFYYSLGFGTTLLATVIPIFYMVRLSPKKILL
ncbi:MAG: ABC transporter permease [Defluviitaleaceae bacterium]|nr:ABC transporter permease [Defluviitaleaceae bacterium]